MMFKCPVCKERHTVPNNYDNKDYICQNGPSRRSRKTFQNMTPDDLLSRNEPLMNRTNTKADVTRAATVLIGGPDFRPGGERLGQLKKNY
jgi:hypothetical protein